MTKVTVGTRRFADENRRNAPFRGRKGWVFLPVCGPSRLATAAGLRARPPIGGAIGSVKRLVLSSDSQCPSLQGVQDQTPGDRLVVELQAQYTRNLREVVPPPPSLPY